jgi:RNA polymerase sigma-54 factor
VLRRPKLLKNALDITPSQSLLMKKEMIQALKILQLPCLELKPLIEDAINLNPLLEYADDKEDLFEIEYSEDNFTKKLPSTSSFPISYIPHRPSMFDRIISQAKEVLEKEEIAIAKLIIGNIDKKGFFNIPIKLFAKEIHCGISLIEKVLTKIQHLEPIGIATKNYQQYFLLQVQKKYPQDKLLLQVLQKYYHEFINGKLSYIAKKLHVSISILQHIKQKIFANKLTPYPLSSIDDTTPTPITPDIFVRRDKNNKWHVDINNQDLPNITFHKNYGKYFQSCKNTEEKRTVRSYVTSAKFLIKSINKRKKLLEDILNYTIKKQIAFFDNNNAILPMTYKELADNFTVHETTIRRAVKDKYILFENRTIALNIFFSPSISKEEKQSNTFAKGLLKKLILEEDKTKPLSDEFLRQKLLSQGITCSRRTVTKYRHKLYIGPANSRRN